MPSGDIIVVCEVVCLHVGGSRYDVRHMRSKRVRWSLKGAFEIQSIYHGRSRLR